MTVSKLGGRPPKKYDAKTALEVRKLAQLGIPYERIGLKVNLAVHTLKKLYSAELEQGKVEAEMALTNSAFRIATDPANPNPAMIMFLLKTRFGYRETERKEVALEVKQKSLKEMSDEELRLELAKYDDKVGT